MHKEEVIPVCHLCLQLRDNISQSENGKIYLTEIDKKLHGEFSSKAIASAMKTEFKGLIIKQTRSKEYWAKRTSLYMGVEWRNRSAPEVEDIQNVAQHQPEIQSQNKIDLDSILTDHSYIKMVEQDHQDLDNVLQDVILNCSSTCASNVLQQFKLGDKMKTLLESQLIMNQTSPKGHRWHPEIIRLCLTLYCRSPKNYEFLSKSGYLILPSASQIRRYKNVVDQQAGINTEVLSWMKNEAELQRVPPEGREGGLLIDEMTIQDDLQLKRVGDEFQLIGFVECCLESTYFEKLSGKADLKLATHVLQLLYLGHSGFRFPVAHFPTTQTSPQELYLITWRCIKMLGLYDFHITYISLDGAQANRVLMKMFLPEGNRTSDTIKTLTFPNVFDPSLPKITVIMDYSHMMKKIRNNILKSGNSPKCTKLFELNGKNILWEHWFKAYQWDITSNTLKVHHKLSQDHFFLDSQLKMRNHLAEDVLDENMLHLMEVYRDSLDDVQAEQLESSIELLANTSKLVKIFRDDRPIRQYEDSRLNQVKEVLEWFRNWEKHILLRDAPKPEKEKKLMSYQTREDVVSCLLGFDEMCKERFKRSFGSIVASRVNSDPIENIFSQQRGIHNGANANPDYLTYCRTTNAIIIGQSSISRKSNAGLSEGANFLSLKARKRNPLQEINK